MMGAHTHAEKHVQSCRHAALNFELLGCRLTNRCTVLATAAQHERPQHTIAHSLCGTNRRTSNVRPQGRGSSISTSTGSIDCSRASHSLSSICGQKKTPERHDMVLMHACYEIYLGYVSTFVYDGRPNERYENPTHVANHKGVYCTAAQLA